MPLACGTQPWLVGLVVLALWHLSWAGWPCAPGLWHLSLVRLAAHLCSWLVAFEFGWLAFVLLDCGIWVFRSIQKSYRSLPKSTEVYRSLPKYTDVDRSRPKSTDVYRCLPKSTEVHRSRKKSTKVYRSRRLPNAIEGYRCQPKPTEVH